MARLSRTTANLNQPQFNTNVPTTAPYQGYGEEFATTSGPREDFLSQLFQIMLGNQAAGTPQMQNIQDILAAKPTLSDDVYKTRRKAAKRQFRRDQANIQESFGRMGARFGTDLNDALTSNALDFRAQLRAQDMATRAGLAEAAKNRSLTALQQILGTGQYTTGLEFTRGESAAQRAIEMALQKLRNEGALDVAGLQAESGLEEALIGAALGL